MKRYSVIGAVDWAMKEDPDGEWVRWKDIVECNCEEVPRQICPKYEHEKRQQKGEDLLPCLEKRDRDQ